jgi:hypothetical protein
MKTIALAVLLATTFAVAQENNSLHPTVYRLEYTITETEGAKKLSSRSYSLQAEEGKPASMRVGTRVPIPTNAEGSQYNYIDVGVNLDVTASAMEASTIRLKTNVDITSLIAPDPNAPSRRPPVARQTKDMVTTVIPLDKPVILTTQDDPSYNTSMQVQVIAHIVK